MPFPDSEYPSVLRGRDKRESQRLLAAAPAMLDALRVAHDALDYAQAQVDSENDAYQLRKWRVQIGRVIQMAEGRG
jgi:hypothetical protein